MSVTARRGKPSPVQEQGSVSQGAGNGRSQRGCQQWQSQIDDRHLSSPKGQRENKIRLIVYPVQKPKKSLREIGAVFKYRVRGSGDRVQGRNA